MDTSKVVWKKANVEEAYTFTTEGQVFEGVLQGVKKVKLPSRIALMFIFKDAKGEFVNIWGSAVLDYLENVPPGTPVRLTYRGEAGKGANKYRNFDIEIPEGVDLKDVPDNVPF